MYYINSIMKNYFFFIIEYIYYFSLSILTILYLFPGSLLGYFIYGNFDQQPILMQNTFGSSLNHFFAFFFLSVQSEIFRYKKKYFINSLVFLLCISLFYEILHYFIPNRAFEFYDLLGNMMGVVVVILLRKLLK